MTAVTDETLCGPVCQHPSCWDAQRRVIRGVPNLREPEPDDSSDDSDGDYDLPTQKVVNLFGDTANEFGSTFYTPQTPPKFPVKRTTSLQPPRSSEGKPSVPNGTPVSGRPTTKTSSSKEWLTRWRNVEVQEVFDLTDLQSNWDETFLAKKYYVWMPSDKQHTPRVENKKTAQRTGLKDVTEELIPRKMEIDRYREQQRKYLPGRKSPSMFFHPPAAAYSVTNKGYHGLHELLDLPRDVLNALMNHIPERDMLDPDRFAQALLRTLPKLEQQNKSVSLAYGNVIYQEKKPILEGRRRTKKPAYEIQSGRQVFKMDANFWEQFVHAGKQEDSDKPVNPPPTMISSQISKETGSARFNGKNPLPDISPCEPPSQQLDNQEKLESARTKKLPPSVNIGLPMLPSNARATRPFHYNNMNNLAFSLEPRDPSVLMQELRSTPSVDSQPAAENDERPCSAKSTERSSLRVTMPSVPRQTESGHELLAAEEQRKSPTKSSSGQTLTGSHSAKIPRPPPTTPMNVYSPRSTPARSAHARDQGGVLDPICEDINQTAEQGPETLPRSRGGRSVRFANDMNNDGTLGAERVDSPSGRSATPSHASAMAASSDGHSETAREDRGSLQDGLGTPRSLVTPLMTPEPRWPQVDEKAIHEATKTPREDSAESGMTGDQLQEMASRASRYRQLWEERKDTTQSPGPPPPSPEPHQVQSPAAIMPERGQSPLSMMPKDNTRTDSGFTISAKPPSTLDDISRIQSPLSFASRPFVSREPTSADLAATSKPTTVPHTDRNNTKSIGDVPIHSEIPLDGNLKNTSTATDDVNNIQDNAQETLTREPSKSTAKESKQTDSRDSNNTNPDADTQKTMTKEDSEANMEDSKADVEDSKPTKEGSKLPDSVHAIQSIIQDSAKKIVNEDGKPTMEDSKAVAEDSKLMLEESKPTKESSNHGNSREAADDLSAKDSKINKPDDDNSDTPTIKDSSNTENDICEGNRNDNNIGNILNDNNGITSDNNSDINRAHGDYDQNEANADSGEKAKTKNMKQRDDRNDKQNGIKVTNGKDRVAEAEASCVDGGGSVNHAAAAVTAGDQSITDEVARAGTPITVGSVIKDGGGSMQKDKMADPNFESGLKAEDLASCEGLIIDGTVGEESTLEKMIDPEFKSEANSEIQAESFEGQKGLEGDDPRFQSDLNSGPLSESYNCPKDTDDKPQGPKELDRVFEDHDLTKAVGLLDQFDATEAQLAEELKKEMEKLEKN